MNKILVSVGGIGAVSFLVWMLIMVPILTNTNDFFEITAQNTGEIQFVDEVGGELSEPSKMIFDWQRRILETNGNNAIIQTNYEYKDILTDESFWLVEIEENINLLSKEYLDKPGYLMFPAHLEKRDYDVYDVGGAVVPYKFEGEEQLNGLTVYKFSGQTTFDISEIYPDFSETIYEDYFATNYIEPQTGLEISFTEKFSDYALVDGEKILVLNAWSESTQFSENILAKKAKQLIVLHDIYEVFIPIIIVVFTTGPLFTIYLHSKNKRKQDLLQSELLKSEKFASLGQLSARLAHDIRNPLNVITLTNELLLNHSDLSDKDKEKLNRIVTSAKRISNQIEDIMGFVRISKSKRQIISLNKIIEQVISETLKPEKIKITNKTTNVNLFVNEGEFYALFHNLIRNSIEAIGENEGEIIITQKLRKDSIEISVQDSGPGIRDSTVSKIFDPLFTTKQSGTGLGLVSCKAIVKNHGGKISFLNSPSTFTISLPLPTLKNTDTLAQ